MTDKEKLEKIKALADKMYYRMAYLTSDTKPIRQAMDEYHKFIVSEYHKEEPVSEKECMYSKDNYTDEDRKVLCDGCKEECEFNKQEEPVSEDLEQAIDTYLATYFGGEKEKQEWPFLKKMAIHFAKWQKEQIIKSICNHANIEQMVEKFEDKYKPEKVLDTEYYKRGIFDTIKTIKED